MSVRFTLHFKDGSLYEEASVYSQRRVFQLLTYRQVQKGLASKSEEILSLDTTTGNVSIEYAGKDRKAKVVADQLALPQIWQTVSFRYLWPT